MGSLEALMGEPPPSTNLWVGDLPPDTDKELLASVFEAYGTIVESRVMPPRHSGQKACAMVRFSSLEEATWIVDNVNGNIPSGLAEPIVVRYANNPGGGGSGGPKPWASTPVQPGPSRVAPAGGKANAGGDPPPSANLWVGDLPPDIDKSSLNRVFEAYGVILDSKVLPPRHVGEKACAMVRFTTVDEASWIVDNVNGNIPTGLTDPIVVRFANNPGGVGAGGAARAWTPTPAALPGPTRVAPTGGKGHVGGEPPASDNLWVGDLPPDIDNESLQRVFEAYGSIVQSKVLPPTGPGQKACAMVRFSTVDEAMYVVENLNGNIPTGLADSVQVRFANQPRAAGGGGKAATPYGSYGPARVQPTIGSKGASPYRAVGAVGAVGAIGGGAYTAPAGAKGGARPGSAVTLVKSIRQAGILGGGMVPNECQVYVKNLPPDMTDLDLFRIFAPFGAIAHSGAKVMMNEDGSCKGFGFVDFKDEEVAALAASQLDGFTCPDGGVINCSQKRPGSKRAHQDGGKGI